ncbi:MAG: hypothetical protein RI964_919 [Pseudomonadota bacterium]|jgi:hypothetical protein
MSTKSTIAHGETFHLYDEVIDGGIYLELDTDDVVLDYGKYLKQPRLRVRLPKALLDRLTLDGKPLVEQPGWANEEQPDREVRDTAEIARALRQKQLWRDSGLIGCLEDGDPNLSTNYKQHIAEYLNEKYK